MKRKHQSGETGTSLCSMHHPKSPYKLNPPNFAQLADLYPERFGKYVRWKYLKGSADINKDKADVSVDFSDSKVAQALTSTLLFHDFNLEVEMPNSDDLFLCPPVPNRVNYVCWISDLVNANNRRDCFASGIKRIGDIGVGPIAIYPILGTTLFHMDFIGSDVNVQAIEHAKKTIQLNHLEHKISVFHVSSTDHYQSLLWERLLSPSINDQKSVALLQLKSFVLDASGRVYRGPLLMLLAEYCSKEVNACEERFLKTVECICSDGMADTKEDHSLLSPVLDAVMVNPPFYTLDEEIQVNNRTSCTGGNLEMRTVGGELAFIAAIIADSLVIRERVRWYTCMVGKKQSLKVLRNLLLREGIEANHIRTTVFEQGVTHRWGIAWSFVADNNFASDSHIWDKNVDLNSSSEGVLDEISVSTRTVNFKMLVSELVNTTTDDEKNAPDFKCDDVLQLAGDRVHSSLLDASTASLSAESKFCKVISFESIKMSMSERLVKSTLSMGPLLFRLQLSIVLHTESENILCGSIRSDGDITCCFPAPSHSSSSSVTASTWIGSELTAESFADLTRKGKEHLQRIADLLQQNVLRSNRRWKRKLAKLI